MSSNRSLTYIKHLDGDVSQLDLTFSVDHDVMGRLVTYELVPGGRALAVTNHNNCDKIGLHFYEEELTAGVVYPSTERVLISVFHSVIDDLFRRSLNASCMRSGAM
uniref:HECT-type E3 ubiquitin transferase n=1 Tax=Rhodnius prolixus TaxID=13249 RepID=T1HNF1_RHOPR